MSKMFVLVLVTLLFVSSLALLTRPACGNIVTGDSWVSKAPMPTARGGLGVVDVGGAIYAIGGSTASGGYPPDGYASGSFVGTSEEYNISTNTWAFKAPMPIARGLLCYSYLPRQNLLYWRAYWQQTGPSSR